MEVYSRQTSKKNTKELTVGTGVTEVSGSDSYPYTVVEVMSPTKCRITPDMCQVLSGAESHGDAEYMITPHPNQKGFIIRKNKQGYWKRLGSPKGSNFYVGHRVAYRDPHF